MTEESKDLIPAPSNDLAQREGGEIDALTRTSDFLPQLRVYGSESKVVKQQKFPMGHLGLYVSQDKIIDLGEQSDVLVIDWRPKTCLVTGDTPVSFFGRFVEEKWVLSDNFINFQAKAMSKVDGYLAGLEYLIWVPSVSLFATFLMGNPTLRRESPNVKALTRQGCTLKVKFIDPTGSSYSWHGAAAFPCTTPMDLPGDEAIAEEIIKFRSPLDSEIEIVDDAKDGGSGRAR